MEEKIRLEEEIRKSLLRYGGDIIKVESELQIPLELIIKVQQKLKKDLMKNPGVDLIIAGNITREILRGRRQRLQIIQDMINTLSNREQLWVCQKCGSEIETLKAEDGSNTYRCSKCDAIVNRKLIERLDIFQQKQSLIRDHQAEDTLLVEWLVKMGWTGDANKPVQPTTVINNRQNILVVGNGKDQKVIDEIKHLPPLEAEKLRQDLKKEIVKIDEQIRETEEGKGVEKA
jgi:DNA-directed RNA polymerase subunit RPC12/RpoP